MGQTAMSRVFLVVLGVLLVLFEGPATAGPDNVVFPAYQDHVVVAEIDRADIKEVRQIYATSEALKMARAGQPLPTGTVLTLVHFKAKVTPTGELVTDPNGRLVKGDLDRIGVMEKRAGWGAEYADDVRNGEWEYALFRPDGARNDQANVKACFQCHKPKAAQDSVFRLEELRRSK